jgi:hypothetical protein
MRGGYPVVIIAEDTETLSKKLFNKNARDLRYN